MQYWRMQVHPNEGEVAVQHSINSLAGGFIGLDFRENVGDLLIADRDSLPSNQKDYWAFAHDMQIGDKVLVICHHFPFAVATIDCEYNYIRTPVREIGVWFRHFRRVKDVKYYADRTTNARDWERLVMTDTISPLHDPNSKSYTLIDEW